MGLTSLFEPEEVVGKLWHDLATRLETTPENAASRVTLDQVRRSVALLFRALGGGHDVELLEAAPMQADFRRRLVHRLVRERANVIRPTFDGETLRLPPSIEAFESAALNRWAYLWMTATAALAASQDAPWPDADAGPGALDTHYLALNAAAPGPVLAACPGLRSPFEAMCRQALRQRVANFGTDAGNALEASVRKVLQDGSTCVPRQHAGAHRASRIEPVPFWLELVAPRNPEQPADASEPDGSPAPSAAASGRKTARRRDQEENNRKDSLIIHRFESILSWTESMNINRSVDDDDEDNAKQAADDQNNVTLSRHDRKIASRLRLHLDLSPAEAEHERLAGKFTYPEWNHKRQQYMPDHCRVLDALAPEAELSTRELRRAGAERVRRQFEVLRTRRELVPRQTEGFELDLDALIAARIDLRATGRGSDRIYLSSRCGRRDLSVGLLLDASRSTEADIHGTCVIDVARQALFDLAHGLDACGDRLGIWSFSSRRRQRVFLNRCKAFHEPLSATVERRIAGIQPGHYTRLGAAIRHMNALLDAEESTQKLLLVLTDGKPNDIDHYEGRHGIEDSRRAVREARSQGLVVHGVIIDEDGQDWFARIFGRGGFTLLPSPQRLVQALPEIYRALTQEV